MLRTRKEVREKRQQPLTEKHPDKTNQSEERRSRRREFYEAENDADGQPGKKGQRGGTDGWHSSLQGLLLTFEVRTAVMLHSCHKTLE